MARNVKFLLSAPGIEGAPDSRLPEIAFTGRSNAGKSSLLNTWSGREIARVSKAPGKTRLLNFFEVNAKYTLVDLPGYGFSKRSGDEQAEWGPMVEDFLMDRPQLVGTILVMDIRRDWTADETQLQRSLESWGLPLAVALTKADQVKPREGEKILQDLKRRLGLPIFLISNLHKTGVEELEDYCFKSWIKNPQFRALESGEESGAEFGEGLDGEDQ